MTRFGPNSLYKHNVFAIIKPLALFFVTLSGTAHAASDAGPALTETTEWLAARLKDVTWHRTISSRNISFDTRGNISSASFDGCRASLTEHEEERSSGEPQPWTEYTDASYTFNLRDLSPNFTVTQAVEEPNGWTITPRQYPEIRVEITLGKILRIHTVGSLHRNGEDHREAITPRDRDQKQLVLRFSPESEDLAERISKALSHAIALCGGKPQLF